MLHTRIEVDIALNTFRCTACSKDITRGDVVFISSSRDSSVACDFRCRECGEAKVEMLRSCALRTLAVSRPD